MSSSITEIVCCGKFDIECNGASAETDSTVGTVKTTLCQPIPTRFILRIRKLFSRTEKSRDRKKTKRGEKMVNVAGHVYIAQTSEEELSTK